MASVKLGTLVIRTLAKPISEQLKTYAKSNQRFRTFCISLAQRLWRVEVRLRETLLGETHHSVKPLNDVKAIQNGANFLAEGFLFSVAASLIIAETWRSARSESRRREGIDDQIEELQNNVMRMTVAIEHLDEHFQTIGKELELERERTNELSNILLRVIDLGLKGNWAEFEKNPIQLPPMDLEKLKPISSSTATGGVGNISTILEHYDTAKSIVDRQPNTSANSSPSNSTTTGQTKRPEK
ncbi:hypothetical protein FRC20_002628 [Serendipita sp. 405]|nr:hypothetical protein FRC20_002628 [Serendipita sp. 405]